MRITAHSLQDCTTALFRWWYYSSIKTLPDDERLEAYDAIMGGAFMDEAPTCSPEVAAVVSMILERIDTDTRNYEEKRAAMLGLKPITQPERNKTPQNEQE